MAEAGEVLGQHRLGTAGEENVHQGEGLEGVKKQSENNQAPLGAAQRA